jgi:hypothetical protein
MLGYGDDEVEPLTDWQQLVHPDDRNACAPRCAIPAGIEPLFERASAASPRWRAVVVSREARVDEQGRAHRIVGVDLT